MRKLSRSLEDTFKIGKELAISLRRGSLILLSGDLGAGKTSLTRGFVSNWGMEDLVTSPTFTLMNEYKNDDVFIVHFDLYRLNSLEEVIDIGLEDYAEEADYCLIEWPDIAIPLLDLPMTHVKIRLGDNEHSRIIEIQDSDEEKANE